MAGWGNATYEPGAPTPGFDLNLTSGGQAATRQPSPLQALAQALSPPPPVPVANRKAAIKADPTDIFGSKQKPVQKKRNPFLINLNPIDQSATGLNLGTLHE